MQGRLTPILSSQDNIGFYKLQVHEKHLHICELLPSYKFSKVNALTHFIQCRHVSSTPFKFVGGINDGACTIIEGFHVKMPSDLNSNQSKITFLKNPYVS